MIILLNLIRPTLPAVVLYRKGKIFFGRKLGRKKTGGFIIAGLKKILGPKKLKFSREDIFAVLTGRASFSGIRSEMALANSLAMAAGATVVAIGDLSPFGRSAFGGEINDLKAIPQIVKKKIRRKYILPEYDREPNITVKTESKL
ncbi:MAG: hypothetical protein AAB731_03340 [Patescibacteria group bacterium]